MTGLVNDFIIGGEEVIDVEERKVYTLKEAADVLGVSYATVQRAVREGQIPAIRFGRNTIRIPKDALDRWLMEKATAATRS